MKKSLLFAISASVLTVAAAVAVCSNNSLFTAKRRDASIYSLSFSSTNNRLVGEGASSLSGSINAKTGEDNNVGITYDKVSGLADAWISLEAGGSFYNTVEVLNMTSLNIVCSANLTISFGWANVDAGVVQPSSFTSYDFEDIALKNGTYSFEGYKPSLIKITNASSEAVGITSLTLNYECGTSADSGVKPDLFKIEDFHRSASDTALNPHYFWYGGKKLNRNFSLEGKIKVNTNTENNEHIIFQYEDNNRTLLWDSNSTKWGFRITGQAGGTHYDASHGAPILPYTVGTIINFRLVMTDNDAYLFLNGELKEVMTNVPADSKGVRFASERVALDYYDLSAKTLLHNPTEYQAILDGMSTYIDRYGSKSGIKMYWPADNLSDVIIPLASTHVSQSCVCPMKDDEFLTRDFCLDGTIKTISMGDNGHLVLNFNGSEKRFLLWRNGSNFNVTGFGLTRGKLITFTANAEYKFRLVEIDDKAYFYFADDGTNLKLRAVGTGIPAVASKNSFNLAGQYFAGEFKNLTAFTKAGSPTEWAQLLTDMNSDITTYTTQQVITA